MVAPNLEGTVRKMLQAQRTDLANFLLEGQPTVNATMDRIAFYNREIILHCAKLLGYTVVNLTMDCNAQKLMDELLDHYNSNPIGLYPVQHKYLRECYANLSKVKTEYSADPKFERFKYDFIQRQMLLVREQVVGESYIILEYTRMADAMKLFTKAYGHALNLPK